jgi:hypothetical protein
MVWIVHRPLCMLGQNLPSRKGRSSSHCGVLAVMNSGSHPEHTMSCFDTSSHARQEWGYMESQWPVNLKSLVLQASGYIDQGKECLMNLPGVSCVPWGSYFYEFRHKAIFLSKKSSQYDIILDLRSEFQVFILLPEINTYNYNCSSRITRFYENYNISYWIVS